MVIRAEAAATFTFAIRIGNPGQESSFSPRFTELDVLLEYSSLIHPRSSVSGIIIGVERNDSEAESRRYCNQSKIVDFCGEKLFSYRLTF